MTAAHISPYAGEWYPGGAAELECLLKEKFTESLRRTGPWQPPRPVGLVVPHAGPAWSGTVAAAAYRAIGQMRPEQVILLAFPHRGGLGRVATPDVDTIRTPLGDSVIDRSFAQAFPAMPEWRVCDHSFEIQLPFLQRVAPDARITPLYVGRISEGQRRDAAAVLAAAWRPGVIFLASSDFTHYGRTFGFEPFPNDRAVEERLHGLDFECIDTAGSLDAEWFLETLHRNGATVCGAEPIALLLDTLGRLAGISVYPLVLDYQTSGEMTADFAHSVSYAALGFYDCHSFELSAADGEALLDSAQATLRRLRATGKREPIPAHGGSDALSKPRGMFVSLHCNGELLGCIGNMAGRRPLALEAAELTLAAALEDPRFRPATEVDGEIDIEISVLTPMRLLRDVAQFRPGVHGALLRVGRRSGLLLPQVAREHEWTTADFLKALARKCGLWPDAWRDPKAQLWVFEAQVLGK